MATLGDVAKLMSEKQLDREIREMLNDLGLSKFSFHPYGAGGYQAGYPDWTIAGPYGLLFRELKIETKQPTAAQKAWIERLRANGQDVDVWRPSDLYTGRIARELTAISGIARSAR